jgi:hypothetical protein
MDAAPAPTIGNFMSHVGSQDAAPSGGGEPDAIPDKSPQIQDVPAPKDPQQPEPELGDDTVVDDLTEPVDAPDELETLRALKAELDAGDALPKSLESRTFPVKINGSTFELPISEIAQGYQRNADYSRKLAEVQQIREEAARMQSGAQALLSDLSNANNPETFIQAAKELGFWDGFVAAARFEGKKRLAMQDLSPEARQYAVQLERERDARAAASRKATQLEQRMQELQKQQPNQDSIRLKHQLDQLVPRAMTKHKVGDYPLARDLFSQNLNNLYEGGEVTAALVDSAAQATAEQLADIAARLPKPVAANDNGRTNGTMAPRRAAPAPGKPLARQKGGTSTDFAAHLERLGGSR